MVRQGTATLMIGDGDKVEAGDGHLSDADLLVSSPTTILMFE